MNNIGKTLIIILGLISLVIIAIKIPASDSNEIIKTKRLVGEYVLDTIKFSKDLDYNSSYRKELKKYKSLRLNLNEDYTFKFNMKVPFIYSDSGRWIVSGNDLDEWNKLNYFDSGIMDQFGNLFDGVIFISGLTPRPGFESAGNMYFVKIK